MALLGGAAAGITGLASAETASTTTQTMHEHGERMGPGVVGTVSSVSGNSLTVTGKDGTTYTVDVTNASIKKGSDASEPTNITASDIVTGDTVMVRGTVNGTSVTATEVMDGKFPMGMHGGPRGMGGGVMGTVSAINGTTITLTDRDGGTFTIDASSATVKESGTTSSLSNVKVGDTIHVGGKITTASMTATMIDDGVPPAPTQTNTTTTQ